MEMEEDGRQRSGAVEMPASGHSDTVENVEAARQTVVTVLDALWGTEAFECWRGYDC
jgi:hypothetical protein